MNDLQKSEKLKMLLLEFNSTDDIRNEDDFEWLLNNFFIDGELYIDEYSLLDNKFLKKQDDELVKNYTYNYSLYISDNIRNVEHYGGENQGVEYYDVIHHVTNDTYYKLSGCYNSWDGINYDNSKWERVHIVEKEVDEYKSINDMTNINKYCKKFIDNEKLSDDEIIALLNVCAHDSDDIFSHYSYFNFNNENKEKYNHKLWENYVDVIEHNKNYIILQIKETNTFLRADISEDYSGYYSDEVSKWYVTEKVKVNKIFYEK